jgi:YidC/Oxa1 family membrane protein insertase
MQPFYLWIHDLSSKDPFYVFPLLAGAAMFVQMKMTPTTTTDPAQAKIMSMMPILFSVFMLSTPSGLALYMFVGSLFSIFQQIIFMKEKTT